MQRQTKYFVLALALIIFFCECVSAENNTSAPPEQPGEVTYQIGDFTITQGLAIVVLIFAVVMIIVIAMAMKPIRR